MTQGDWVLPAGGRGDEMLRTMGLPPACSMLRPSMWDLSACPFVVQFTGRTLQGESPGSCALPLKQVLLGEVRGLLGLRRSPAGAQQCRMAPLAAGAGGNTDLGWSGARLQRYGSN